ncbi:hypothetical protein [Micromonospora sp. RP3T]|uniref:hypothetical protein n=1 Tax=Micromonospora sp. RP3T TaxID=2135446 RepID=UPI003D755E67
MRIKIVLAGALLALPTAAIAGSAAFADPAGCSAATTSFGLSSGELRALGEGRCSTSANRNLQVGVKQDLSLQPDPVVTHTNDNGSKTYYSGVAQSCDSGNTSTYYGRTFFTTNTTYHDSSHKKLTVC